MSNYETLLGPPTDPGIGNEPAAINEAAFFHFHRRQHNGPVHAFGLSGGSGDALVSLAIPVGLTG